MRSLLAVVIGLLFHAVVVLSPLAQEVPPYKQGVPSELKDSTLAPHSPSLTAKPGKEIPLDKLQLPPGFKAELWAEGLPNARSLTLGSKGTVLVGTRLVGAVYAVVDRNGTREVKTIAKGLHRPNGVAFKDGNLYVAELSRVIRFDDIENHLDNPPPPVVVFDALPKDEPHGWKYLALGPDGWLYFNIGAPCNICVPPYTHAQIVRLDPDRRVLEPWAWGVRMTQGMDWDPVTRELWFTENQRDWAGDDMPSDKLNHAATQGLNFGFPFCHEGNWPDPDLGRGRSCAAFAQPVVKLATHCAAGHALLKRQNVSRRVPAPHPDRRARLLESHQESWLPGGAGEPGARWNRQGRSLYDRFSSGRGVLGPAHRCSGHARRRAARIG